MRAKYWLAAILLPALALATAVAAVRVARHFSGHRIEISEFKVTQLDDATKTRLRSLKDKVFLTYFASPRQVMPSHMRDIERNVSDLFAALKEASGGMLDYQIIDPHRSRDLERYASNRKISRIRVRSVARDAYSENTVWSGVSISYGAHPPAIVNGIELPEHVERLQSFIINHLNQMESPRLPVVAVAAPNGAAKYKEMIAALAEPDKNTKKIRAKVATFDFKPGANIPDDVDILFWMEPGTADPRQIRELNLFLQKGRCAVVAGSEMAGDILADANGLSVKIKKTGVDSAPLLSEFGLLPVRELVLDQSSLEYTGGQSNEKTGVPNVHRVIGYNQDFRTMRGQPNGNLLFDTPTCMQTDAARLAERRWNADLLVTSSDKSWIMPLRDGPVAVRDLVPEKGEIVAKQPLIVGLRHDSPFHGSIVFSGSETPFVDGWHLREGTAHWRLLRVLIDTLGSDERLVQNQTGLGRFAPVPELAAGEKLFWRIICLMIAPVVFIIFAIARGAIQWGGAADRVPSARRGPLPGIVLRLAACMVAAGVLVAVVRAAAYRVDLTDEKINLLSQESGSIASRQREPVKVELYFSSNEHLPPALRPHVGRVLDVLREFRRAGAKLQIEAVDTDNLDAAARARLEGSGIAPVKLTVRDEESTVTKTVYSAMRMSRGGRTETLLFPGIISFENIEFRIAFALVRLDTGRRPHIGFASDVPRLTPAEDWDFQQQQLLAPKGADVYSVARDILRGCDFKVTHINPREPVLPPDIDLLIWFQPRRDICKMIEETSKYLNGGGRVLLAAQHFNMQSRQYRGRSFDIVYWPQPQFNDVDMFYYPDLGIRMVNEVLFDNLKTRMALDAQVFRSAVKEYKPMESALPFLVRAAGANFADGSLITKNLGDQALLFSSFIEWDEARLNELGITAKPLIFTSAQSWSYAWKGGWIPNGSKDYDYWDLLNWPPERKPKPESPDDAAAGTSLMPKADVVWNLKPRVPMAVLFEGRFPVSGPLALQNLYPQGGAESKPAPLKPDPNAKPGSLLMVGCSEAFKNYRILHKEFRADHFLINAAAALSLDPGLAGIATRRPVARGFELSDPEARARWRGVVVAGFPAILFIFGLIYFLIRAMAPVRSRI